MRNLFSTCFQVCGISISNCLISIYCCHHHFVCKALANRGRNIYLFLFFHYSLDMLCGPDGELPEKLRNLEPRLIEHVSNEIMDKDPNVRWDDIGSILRRWNPNAFWVKCMDSSRSSRCFYFVLEIFTSVLSP